MAGVSAVWVRSCYSHCMNGKITLRESTFACTVTRSKPPYSETVGAQGDVVRNRNHDSRGHIDWSNADGPQKSDVANLLDGVEAFEFEFISEDGQHWDGKGAFIDHGDRIRCFSLEPKG